MTLEEMMTNVETSISKLKAFLIQEKLLTENPDEPGSLITNQDPEAIEAFNTRRFMDVRF